MADFDAKEEEDLGAILNDIAERIPEEAILDSMKENAEYLVESVVESIYSLAKDPKSGLTDSYNAELLDTGKEVVYGVFSSLVYAEIQDVGGPITPQTVKWLAYPHKDAKSFVGIRWPSDFPKGDLGFALSSHDPQGTAYLFGKNFKHPTFILKKKVEIPGLQYLDKALEDFGKDAEKSFDKNIGLAFSKGGF